jgi:hypothetical protein
MISLKGRKTLITGGSRGIGRAAVRLFAMAGSDVAFTYGTRQDAAAAAKAEVEKEGRACLSLRCDIANETEVRDVVARIVQAWGGIDVLVNNAGIWTALTMGEANTESWKETMAVNLDSVYYFCDAVVPHMEKGLDHQRRIDGGDSGGGLPLPLCGHQRRPERPDQVVGGRIRPLGHQRQLRRPRLGGYGYVYRGLFRRGLSGERPAVHPPAADSPARGYRRADPVPGFGPGPPYHRGDHQRQRRLGPLRVGRKDGAAAGVFSLDSLFGHMLLKLA